jgi:hypothetical protein
MSKKPYTKKAKTKTIKIFGSINQSIYFPPDTTLDQGLDVLKDTLNTGTETVQMPM